MCINGEIHVKHFVRWDLDNVHWLNNVCYIAIWMKCIVSIQWHMSDFHNQSVLNESVAVLIRE